MFTKLQQRLSYANVTATLALFVALAGVSYAAIELERGSVKGKHIAKNAITSPKVKNESLQAEDFGPGQLPRGEQGLQGIPGPAAASWLAGGGFATDDADLYCGPTIVQAGNACGTDEGTVVNERSALSPNATIVAQDLFVKQAGTSSPGSRIYSLRVEGTDTAVSCTIAGSAQSCNSGAATATIPPGNRIVLHIEGTSLPGGNGFWFGWRATTP